MINCILGLSLASLKAYIHQCLSYLYNYGSQFNDDVNVGNGLCFIFELFVKHIKEQTIVR